LKNAELFYFCHLKKLVRLETFGPYHIGLEARIIVQQIHWEAVDLILQT